MGSFSQRHGFKPVRTALQSDNMDQDLRNGLWNAILRTCWPSIGYEAPTGWFSNASRVFQFIQILWTDYFKKTLDTVNKHWPTTADRIKSYFFKCEWFEVYDLMEFLAANYSDEDTRKLFILDCNAVLAQESSSYRFINGLITPITSDAEISAIEEALQGQELLKPVQVHLANALQKLSDRKSPDFRNSIKESISAVEALCNIITKDKGTLGDVLKNIPGLHPALKDPFTKLYGYTNDAQGIRHALMDEEKLGFEDAKFMLVSCSAFTNYLALKFLPRQSS